MKINNISFGSDLEETPNIFDSNLDVFVELENGKSYTVVVGTLDNVLTLMDNAKSDFLELGDPIIIVRKMTKETIEDAIQSYAEDKAYYLKFYAASLDVKTLDVLHDRSISSNRCRN